MNSYSRFQSTPGQPFGVSVLAPPGQARAAQAQPGQPRILSQQLGPVGSSFLYAVGAMAVARSVAALLTIPTTISRLFPFCIDSAARTAACIASCTLGVPTLPCMNVGTVLFTERSVLGAEDPPTFGVMVCACANDSHLDQLEHALDAAAAVASASSASIDGGPDILCVRPLGALLV